MKINKRKAALDRALEKKLYKIGENYGKQLAKIYGKKSAQDMATRAALDILSLNKRAGKDGWIDDLSKNINSLKQGYNYSQGIEPNLSFQAGRELRKFGNNIINAVADVPRTVFQSVGNFGEGLVSKSTNIKPIMPSIGQFNTGRKLAKISNQISGAAQKAVEFGGTQAANFGKSISNMVGGISPKAAELFAKYPKTTGLAAAAALLGAGYGAYKLYNSKPDKKQRR